jgi:hypothetical protein
LSDPVVFDINHDVLDSVASISDLGVTVDQSLTFWEHIQNITVKAHARANHIIRCFISQNTESLVKAFKIYVRPLLEYCSTVWSPTTMKGINAIELVQRRFTKRLSGMKQLTYIQRLQQLKLDTLEVRRLRADLILTYKILFGLVKVEASEIFTVSTTTQLRGHQYKLFLPRSNTEVRKHSFAIRSVTLWNELPAERISFDNINSFKRSINHLDFSKYIKYNFD